MAAMQSKLIPSQRMRVAYLLTFVGGFLDAYTYFIRGGVFANAQTGNIVKLGIAFSNGARDTYLSYLLPIAAFAFGLLTSLVIDEVLSRRNMRLIRRSVLGIEILGLVVVGFIPLDQKWDTLANCIVSFVAAMQYETFTTFRGDAIVTTMSTGNLRKCLDNLYKGMAHRNREQLFRAARYLSIIVTFCAGAFFGTRACDLMGRAAVIPAIAALACAILVITLLHHRNVKRG